MPSGPHSARERAAASEPRERSEPAPFDVAQGAVSASRTAKRRASERVGESEGRSPSVLLTGASGFIGRASIGPLIARGFDVHAVSSRAPRDADPRVTWHRCDLLAPDAPERIVDAVRPTHVLHFAWYAVPGKYWTAPENEAWAAASLALARAFAGAGGERFVGAGSCAEYAATDGNCDERTTPLAPATPYGAGKLAVHRGLDALAAGRFSCAWGRIFFLYGPHEDASRLVPGVIQSLLQGREALCTAGTQVRDFMHVEDVGDAFAALLASGVEGPVNIASGQPVRLADVVTAIAAQLDAPDLVKLGARPIPAGELPSITAATARLTGEVGWTRARPLAQGLAETIAWWRRTPPIA
jgi:nucleoside-diphosphate-sugar epimerase